MIGKTNLNQLLTSLAPRLDPEEFVFICRPNESASHLARLRPVATVQEAEGLTLIISRRTADELGETYHGVFHRITLQVHSSLHAAGLTATVSGALFQHGIAVNIIAGYYHDHLFIPAEEASDAVDILNRLSSFP